MPAVLDEHVKPKRLIDRPYFRVGPVPSAESAAHTERPRPRGVSVAPKP